MTAPEVEPGSETTVNFAGPGAAVGIQAHEVHNSDLYVVHPQATPQEKFKTARNCLDASLPSNAREMIADAIGHGFDTDEVRFYQVLAILSGRSYRDVDRDERARLIHVADRPTASSEDTWALALDAISELIRHLDESGGDPNRAKAKILALHSGIRAEIDRHLSHVLDGATRDALWSERRDAARKNQRCDNRTDRVWAFFQPEPIDARARRPRPRALTTADWMYASVSSLLFVAAVGYLGWLAFASIATLAVSAFAIATLCGYFGLRNLSDWRYRAERLRLKDRQHDGWGRTTVDGEPGFAKEVTENFDYFFGKYRPSKMDRARWLEEIDGVRAHLRNEIVEIYRESRITPGRVNWLIRRLAWNVRSRWRANALYDYRLRLQVQPSAKLWSILPLAVMVLAMVPVISSAVQLEPIFATLGAVGAVASGLHAAVRWQAIIAETRRYADDHEEYREALEDRRIAFRGWKTKLDRLRPTDTQMESWLQVDKTLLINEALQHYRLSWRDVISHAFLQSAGQPCKQARVQGGPMRYSKYDLRLFLITADGVREVSTTLDFERAAFQGQQRNNYRFEAVSSVDVAHNGGYSYALDMTLTNGPTRNVRVTEPSTHPNQTDEEAEDLSRLNLDNAGFSHALHILEGIAAEGKRWIERVPSLGRDERPGGGHK